MLKCLAVMGNHVHNLLSVLKIYAHTLGERREKGERKGERKEKDKTNVIVLTRGI